MLLGGVIMDEPLFPAPKTAAEYRAALDTMVAEMQRMHERSEARWIEIERLKAESKAIRAQTDRTLDRIDARLNLIEALL
jgi:predicted  nucleic acid-binding Zn-ribbon protein